MKKISHNMHVVRTYLEKIPKLRDNDRRLVGNIWCKNLGDNNINVKEIKAIDFIKLYVEGKVPSPHTISRCRRKLQEEDKTLRGESWYKRKGRAEEFKQDIINFKYNL